MFLILVTGNCGSGKSVFSEELKKSFIKNCIHAEVINADHYYHDHACFSQEERAEHDFCKPDCIEHSLLTLHVTQLQQGLSVQQPLYDIGKSKRLSETLTVAPPQVLIVEGLLVANYKKLTEISSVNIYIDLPMDVCLARRLLRDVQKRNQSFEFILSKYESKIRNSFFKYTNPSKEIANLVLKSDADKLHALHSLTWMFNNLLSKNIISRPKL